jgi:hypothetical protein
MEAARRLTFLFIVTKILAEISGIPLFDHVPLYRLPDSILYKTADHAGPAFAVRADSAKLIKVRHHNRT